MTQAEVLAYQLSSLRRIVEERDDAARDVRERAVREFHLAGEDVPFGATRH